MTKMNPTRLIEEFSTDVLEDQYGRPYKQHTLYSEVYTDKKINMNGFWDVIDGDAQSWLTQLALFAGIEVDEADLVDEATELREWFSAWVRDRYGVILPTIDQDF